MPQSRFWRQYFRHHIARLVISRNPNHDRVLVVDQPAQVVLPAEEVLCWLRHAHVLRKRFARAVVDVTRG
jgi:hypothetical protein